MSQRKKTPAKPDLRKKLIVWPKDWIEAIDEARGETPSSEFVRQVVLEKIGRKGLSKMPSWGRTKRTENGSAAPGHRMT